MGAVAEKQTRTTAAPARRAATRPLVPALRPILAWSAKSAGEQQALRAIVGAPSSAPAQSHAVQRAITVGPADDEFEREADAKADEVMRAPALQAAPDSPPVAPPAAPAAVPPPAAQRECAECGDDELQREALEEDVEESVQREITVGAADDEYEREADAIADQVMRLSAAGREGGEIDDADLTARLRAPGSGRPLPEGTRAFIEPRLGHDFSQVRVHDSAEERQDAARLNARAFTYGRHIWIGPGESADNPRLMAHELTHVVQQGAAQPVVQREEGDESWFGAAGWALVRLVAPGLEANLRPIIERGPLGFLQDQLASAFDSLTGALNALLPQGALDTLAELFDELVARAEPIVAALRAGDCEPLFAAIDELKTFVTDAATGVWDKLVEFVSPVGEFFTDLWSGFGAPAIEWLQNFAGDVWAAIQQLAADLWDWTAPVRNAVTGAFSSAWGWVKDQLGLGDDPEGDSEGGVVAWIQGLATEAWDWFKNQTRPVWQPVVQLAEEINALIPPPFVRRLGEQFSELGASLNAVNEEASGGDDVAANREALAAALPTLEEVIDGVRGILVTAGGWLNEKVDLVTGGFGALLARLRGHSLLAPLGDALSWLDAAAQSMGRWAHGQVSQLFGFLLAAFDFLAPFVRRLVATVQNVIEVAGDLMQLPAMVLNTVWNLIPACIRDPIKDFVINQILRRIPVFSTLLELPDIWARVEATALRILRQVFVDGDLARAAWTYFSAILEIIGIPSQLVVSILAKAATAIGDILGNPVGFLLNLLSAIKEGFIRFFSNIGTHLLGGVTGWLFGQLTRGGITPPADFSLGSILGFVLQVLDITVDRVFERLARRIDPAIVQRLRAALEFATGVWRFVSILVEEGPAGLWVEIQEQLAGLWDRVLDGVIGWLTTTIITQVSARLLTMLDPSGIGAAVNSAIALYRAIQSAVEYIREVLEMIDRVLDGIGGIARGAIDVAAGFLETALASGIPVAIGFLANQIGLSGVGERIQEMVESVREMVDRAIDWVIDRAIAGGQALINMLRGGAPAPGAGAEAPPADVAAMTPDQRKEAAREHVERALADGESGTDLNRLLPQVKEQYQLIDARLDLSDPAEPGIVYEASAPIRTRLTRRGGTAATPCPPPAAATPSLVPDGADAPTPYGAVAAAYPGHTNAGAFQVQARTWFRPRGVRATIVGANRGGERTSLIAQCGHVGNDEYLLVRGEAPPSGYDGGHLIGLQLYDGSRANQTDNISPQHRSFNRSIWVQTENMVAASPVCAASGGDADHDVPVNMNVQLRYAQAQVQVSHQQLLDAGAIDEDAQDSGRPVRFPSRVASNWRMTLTVQPEGYALSTYSPDEATLSATRHRPTGRGEAAPERGADESFIWYKVGATASSGASPAVGGGRTESIEGQQETP